MWEEFGEAVCKLSGRRLITSLYVSVHDQGRSAVELPRMFQYTEQLFGRDAILPYVPHLASLGHQPKTDTLGAVVAFSRALKLTLSVEGA